MKTCDYYDVRLNGVLISRGTYGHAVTVLTQLQAEGIKAELIKVYPTVRCES